MRLRSISILGCDPITRHRLNANSFQQDALISWNGWQYCAYYTAAMEFGDSVRHVSVARRNIQVQSGPWEFLTLTDYSQTADDGHNTISMGICQKDGTIHLAFDHHCDRLKYRTSVPKVTDHPEAVKWSTSLFGPVLSSLPGIDTAYLHEVTYPRFVHCDGNILFECRIGMAGDGSDVLYSYEPHLRKFTYIGVYLVGINNNPYIHGLSYEPGQSRFHVCWMYREYVKFDKSASLHAQHAGPNGPENNRDLAYAYSDDYGRTWKTSDGAVLMGKSIKPESPGVVICAIPCGNGLLNQEGQCVDRAGNFHIFTRHSLRTGILEWQHVMRDAHTGVWTTAPLPHVEPTPMGRRGSVCSDPATGNIYFIVPGNKEDTANVFVRRKLSYSNFSGLGEFELLCSLTGYDGEPLVDEQRLTAGDGILSVFTATSDTPRRLSVLDFDLTLEPCEPSKLQQRTAAC